MSKYLEFEKNIEEECVSFLSANDIKAHATRKLTELGASNIQCIFNYEGSIDDGRQRIGKTMEYNLHRGTMSLVINTYRAENNDHYEIVGKVRGCFLNSYNPWNNGIYRIYDLKPEASQTLEDEEVNADQTTLSYTLHFQTDFDNLK